MIQFKYRNFSEDVPDKTQNIAVKKGAGFGTAMNLGFAGLTGIGMVKAHKQGKIDEKEGKQNIAEMERQTRALNRRLDEIEKDFGIPSIIAGVANASMMGGSMIQSHNQSKKQEEMNEEQLAAQDRQTKAIQRQNALLKRIEQRGMSPEAAAKVVEQRNFSSILKERNYGVMSSLSNIGKDIYKAGKAAGVGKGLKSNITWGLGTAGAAYGVNKIISHDMKKSGLDVDESGNLVQKQKAYADAVVQAASTNAKKKTGRTIFNKIRGGAATPLMMGAFEVPRAIGYFGEKKALKDQIRNTQISNPNPVQPSMLEQRSYGISVGEMIKTVKGGWNTFNKHKMRTITGGILNMGSFGTFGTKRVQDMAGHLAKNSNSSTLRSVGRWAQNHQTLANTAMIAPGIALGSGAYSLGEKIVKKPMQAIDPDAYKYQDAKDKAASQPIQQQYG